MSTTSTSLARQRITSLLDENSFVEIGAMVTARSTDFNLNQTDTPSDGVITGYGVVEGNLVYVYSQDVSVLNGTVGEMHAKKIVKLYDLAMKTGAPIIGLLDCAGIRLQEATDALNGFGEIYLKQTLASGVVPQFNAVFGTCGGGLAVFPAMADFTFMEEKAKLFVNSPNALAENDATKNDTANASFQAEMSGAVDGVGSEQDILAMLRQLVGMLPSNNEEEAVEEECADDLNRICDNITALTGDTAMAVAELADDRDFFEVRENYAKDMVTGFAKFNGMTVGIVANRTEVYNEEGKVTDKFDAVLSVKGCEKAAKFVNFCDAFNIPVVSLTNVKGFEATVCSEKNIAKAVAKLIYAFANATVPKVNVIVGQAYGSAYVAMNSKAIGADTVIAWDTAKIGSMDAKMAAKILCEGQGADAIGAKAAEYDTVQNGVKSAAARGYVDMVIDAKNTRKYVIAALEMLYTKREERPAKKHGTV